MPLEYYIFKLLNNELTQCGICGFTKEGKIIDEEHPNYFRIISNIEIPNFIFFCFDLLNENDEGTELELKNMNLLKEINIKIK